ncbi:MAG: ParB/RepB/Spo0J family partition protein [Alphaproteobacteria bacterium]|nr:MAG: ParB/RepB/Spo0J family partition protein [Alphaproteobacteria bacterium]
MAEGSRLGRGLAALIGDVGDEAAVLERQRSQRRVPIEFVKPNPRNPRRAFAEVELEELAASIRERGIIQPILVRTVRGAIDQYEIVAGERRWRAAQRAGLHDVPVLLLEVSDRESLELAIIENVQRADLNALEEAQGYQALADEFKYSQDDIAKIVGKSRPHVANTLRLLKLSDAVKAYVNSGQLTAGHARLLVGQPNAEEFAELIVTRGLNVRQVEEMARRDGRKQARAVRRTGRIGPDPDAAALEKRLTDALGLTVRIVHRADGEGILSIRYRSLEQLDDITRRLETGQRIVGAPKPGAQQLEMRREEAEERARAEANKGPRIRSL